MKIIVAIAFCFISLEGFSQSFRVSAIASYVTGDEVSGTFNTGASYSGKFKAGFQWGAGAEYLVNRKYGIEFTFQHQNTTLPVSLATSRGEGVEDRTLKLGWMFLKGNRFIGDKANKLQGVFGLGAGICMANSVGLSGNSKGFFAMQGNAGLIYWPANFIGIKLNSQYSISLEGTGDTFYPDISATGGIKSSTPLSQVGIGVGLVLVLDGLAENK